jgi:type IX secretion system PorP/SprF family membrane protein
MAPQLVNPSLVGTGGGAWRIMGNIRQQWSNAGTSFNTSSLSGDTRIRFYEGSNSFIGVGGQVLSDKSLNGAFQSVHAAGSVSYHVSLNEQSRIGMGMQAMYSNRRLDYTALRFGEQFSSGGFDAALPSGETKIAENRSFMSFGTGLQYAHTSEWLAFEFGIAAFHLNRPVQSLLDDANRILPARYTAHASVDYRTTSDWLVNMNVLFQQQASVSSMSAGASFGKNISASEIPVIVSAGAWYRHADAVYPFISLQWDKVQIGLSYDVNVSKQLIGPSLPRSLELSLVIRDILYDGGYIPCPWK